MAIVVGIDGTSGDVFGGRERRDNYDRDFKDSFVSKICNVTDRQYYRGPLIHGGGLLEAIFRGTAHIVMQYVRNRQPIMLTGYSRGGAGVIGIAQRLTYLLPGVRIQAMLLFDAVDRHPTEVTGTIPGNVRNVLHLRRDWRSWSRVSFSNTGTRHRMTTNYRQEFFRCTHGAMGGMYWTPKEGETGSDRIHEGGHDLVGTSITYDQDRLMSANVWQNALPFMREHGLI